MKYNIILILCIIMLLFISNLCCEPQDQYNDDSNQYLYLIKKNMKYGFIDITGKIIIEPKFDDAWEFKDEVAAVSLNKKWGFINKQGTVIIQPQYEIVLNFFDGLAAVLLNKKWGYIDKNGNMVINTQFDMSGSPGFMEGLAVVKQNQKYGYINMQGDFVIKPEYDDAFPFKDGFATVGYGDHIRGIKFGLINKKGEKVIDFKYDSPLFFHEGLTEVQVNDLYGYMDYYGKLKIEPQYEFAYSFSNGIAAVEIEYGSEIGYGHWGYIDKSGLLILDLKKIEIGDNFKTFKLARSYIKKF